MAAEYAGMKLDTRLVAVDRPIASIPQSMVIFNSILGSMEESKGMNCPEGRKMPVDITDSKEEMRKPTIPANKPKIRASIINVHRTKEDLKPRDFKRPISHRLS